MGVSEILATERWCLGCRRFRSVLRFGARAVVSPKTGANKLCREHDAEAARERMRRVREAA
jgi:hypothetical protein